MKVFRLRVAMDLLFDKRETHRVVGGPTVVADRSGVPLWHELGCHAGADDAAKRRLPIA